MVHFVAKTIDPLCAEKFRELAETYPLSVPSGDTNIPPKRPSSSLSNASSQGSASGPASDYSLADGRSSSGSISSGSTTVTTPNGENSSVVSVSNSRAAFIFILVLKASRYRLVTKEVSKKTSRDFFQALIEEYNKQRGILLRTFSIFVYSHCDFAKARGNKSHRPHPLFESKVPKLTDPWTGETMGAQPLRPGNQVLQLLLPALRGPRARLHRPGRCRSRPPRRTCSATSSTRATTRAARPTGHRLRAALSAVLPGPGPPCEVSRRPVRRTSWTASPSGTERWTRARSSGAARERRSAARVVAYTLLGLAPSLVFMFEWMFGWGHLGDLQNATVPLITTCTIWGMLWAIVYSGSDVKKG